MQIAPGESAQVPAATALTWEQAAGRIRELLDEGKYASQAMLYRAWPFEKNRVAEALQYLHRDIDGDYKDKYLPTLTAALDGTFIYPDVVDKTKELLEQPEHLEAVIGEFLAFQKDYVHNRDILHFHSHHPDEIMQGLVDLQCTPLIFAASPDYAPVERFFISQDEIDALLREQPQANDHRIALYNFFEQHPDRKEREKYLSHLHGEYSGYHGGNDNITYGFAINRYFVEHPDMVLGELSSKSTQYAGEDFTVNPLPGADLGELLREAVSRVEGYYAEAETVQVEDEKEQESIPADPEVKNFSYTIVKGDVYYRQDSVMVKVELGATAKARTTALIDLRDCTQRLINEQLEGYAPDESIRHTQEELNRLYDNFTAKFGLINDKINERVFSQDSSYYLLCALEILDDEGKFVRKSDMFTKRTIYPHQQITHVDTAAEALAVSIGERARVDIPFMAGLTGKAEDEIISDLQGQIYRVPMRDPHIYQTADEYLSGNVREKLKVAEAAATVDPAFNINVNALAAVQPRDLDASEISVRLGTDWIEPEYVEQFMRELLKTPGYAWDSVHVQYSSQIKVWNISNKSTIRENDVAAYSTYGTKRASAYELLESALNLKTARIYDIKEENGKEKRVLNAKETTLAQQKQEMIKLAFQDWIWRDPDRRQKLVRKYNDEMNCIRPRQYDGSHLVLAGMNPEIQLEEHQKNAIARAVYGGNTLFAHCVGAGKTFEITASAMEMKRLGLCSKSMIVVPNHITQQWASEFLRLYPNANILVTTKRDFEKDWRKKFCSRIATGDYDAVIIGYSQFERIPISRERQIDLLYQQIDDIVEGIRQAKEENGQRFTVKQLERTKKSLEARLERLQADDRKDDVVNFEELGVDRLFVDEADNFKNMFLYVKAIRQFDKEIEKTGLCELKKGGKDQFPKKAQSKQISPLDKKKLRKEKSRRTPKSNT